jgi:hypothetical protein
MAAFVAIPPETIARPKCLVCGAQMWLARVYPEKPGCDQRTFECPIASTRQQKLCTLLSAEHTANQYSNTDKGRADLNPSPPDKCPY